MKKYYKKTTKLKWESVLIYVLITAYFNFFAQLLLTGLHEYIEEGLLFDTGKYVNNLQEIMLSSFLTIVTIMYIIGEWGKENYVIYTIDNIIEKHRLRERLSFMLILVAFQYLCFFTAGTFQNINDLHRVYIGIKMVMLINFLFFLGFLLYIVALLIDIFLGNQTQRKMLKELYVYIGRNLPLQHKNDIKREFILESLEYLLEEYKKDAKKVKWEDLSNIEYKSNIENVEKERDKVLRRMSLGQLIPFDLLFSIIFFLMVSREKWWCIGVGILIFLGLKDLLYRKNEPIRNFIIDFTCGHAAYWYQRKHKYKVILMFSLSPEDKYTKYIQSFENIVVFCRTLINEEKDITDIKKTLVEAYKENSEEPIGAIILLVEKILKEREERIGSAKTGNKRSNKTDEAKEWKNICYECKKAEYASMAEATYKKINWK